MAEQVSTEPLAAAAPGQAEALSADTTRGWEAFREAVNVNLPQFLNRAERVNAATMRLLGE